MKKQEYIKNLIMKFSKGKLTPLEAKELLTLINQSEENADLKQILTIYWQESANEDADIPSVIMFEKLKNSMDVLELSFDESKIKNRNLKLFIYLKYAAVILMTFGITWLAKDFVQNKKSDKINKTENLANNEISVLFGSKSKITLPDGSVVMLNSTFQIDLSRYMNYKLQLMHELMNARINVLLGYIIH